MISVIVPVFNAENYLEACLESICRQTYKDLEILLIDDSSTDRSYSICEKYVHKDSRFRLFRKENSGPSGTRNFGIDHAGGEYVMFFDSDDYAAPDLCEKLLNAMLRDGTDIAFCGYYNVATAKTTRRLLFDKDRVFCGEEYRDEIQIATLGLVNEKLRNPEKLDKLTPVWARLYKRSIIAEHNIRYIDLKKVPSECLLFNFEYCLSAGAASYVNEALYYYRRNTGMSQTKPYREDLWGRWEYWITYMEQMLSEQEDQTFRLAYYSRLCCAVIPLGGNALKRKTRRERRDEMRLFLQSGSLQNAFLHFDYSRCPVYWKMFFYSAKKQKVGLFYFLTWSMRKILGFRKK